MKRLNHFFSKMPTIYIDFEAFQHKDGTFQLKELCIMENPTSYLSYIFRPEHDWNEYDEESHKTFLYQFRLLHHLHWEEGVTRYCASCISHHITHKFPRWHAATFMVLDTATGAKLGFLKREFPQLNIVHAYNVTFSTLPEVVAMCPYRDHGKHCSFIKCCQMHKHFDF